MLTRRRVLAATALIASVVLVAAVQADRRAAARPRRAPAGGISSAVSGGGLRVASNRLVNQNGRTVVLHGVDRAGSEYACIQGFGVFEAPAYSNDDAQVRLMARWHVNTVFVGLNEDCWLGINGVSHRYGGDAYIRAIVHETKLLESRGIYPIVGLFWSAPGHQPAGSQAAMPDASHSPSFWQSVARTFHGDPEVILRLKEEPFPAGNTDTRTAWACWKNGDVQYAEARSLRAVSHRVNCHERYAVAGMQSLVNIIRGAGAQNVIQVPGVEYANSMTHFLDHAFLVHDDLSPAQLMADVDVYPEMNLCGSPACYAREYAPVMARMPFMAGEIGEGTSSNACPTARVDALMRFFDAHHASYAAWAWDTYGGCLQLIKSYATGAPYGHWGRDYHNHLAKLG